MKQLNVQETTQTKLISYRRDICQTCKTWVNHPSWCVRRLENVGRKDMCGNYEWNGTSVCHKRVPVKPLDKSGTEVAGDE